MAFLKRVSITKDSGLAFISIICEVREKRISLGKDASSLTVPPSFINLSFPTVCIILKIEENASLYMIDYFERKL